VKPAAFDYHRVDTADEAIERLAELGDEAKVLAGGQSLVPMMNFRLVRPPALVDVSRVAELRGLRREDGVLRIGALTRHAEVEHAAADDLAGGFEILRRAARFVGHFPIRARGTFGGSVAHADPAAEWCMLAVALDAEIVVRGPDGRRAIPAREFFAGFFTTTLEPAEIVEEVRFPRPWRHAAIQEFARRHGDFAIVAAVVALEAEDGVVRDARVVVGGVDEVPVRAEAAEAALRGRASDAFADAAKAAAAEVDPSGDIHGSAEYRRELTGVLVRRALEEARDGG
jgi:aerobic carbon-monoxide dehydrogenase medium subunit